MDHAAALLGLRRSDVDAALNLADQATPATVTLSMSGIALALGDRVAFTGDMHRDRAEWESIARKHGLEAGGVTRKTRVVVAADPNSLSGKAAKARAYGVPVITEAAFQGLLESQFAT